MLYFTITDRLLNCFDKTDNPSFNGNITLFTGY